VGMDADGAGRGGVERDHERPLGLMTLSFSHATESLAKARGTRPRDAAQGARIAVSCGADSRSVRGAAALDRQRVRQYRVTSNRPLNDWFHQHRALGPDSVVFSRSNWC
jgi:hypothetical protein